MPVTPSYRAYILEQLNRAVPPVRARAMFGGVGLDAGEVFFALIADDALLTLLIEGGKAPGPLMKT